MGVRRPLLRWFPVAVPLQDSPLGDAPGPELDANRLEPVVVGLGIALVGAADSAPGDPRDVLARRERKLGLQVGRLERCNPAGGGFERRFDDVVVPAGVVGRTLVVPLEDHADVAVRRREDGQHSRSDGDAILERGVLEVAPVVVGRRCVQVYDVEPVVLGVEHDFAARSRHARKVGVPERPLDPPSTDPPLTPAVSGVRPRTWLG